jgi:hypothetical protein
MKMARNSVIHRQIDASQKWNYPVKVQRRPARRAMGGDGNEGSAAQIHESLDAVNRLGDNAGAGYARRGTINLIKNLLNHRVNKV